MSNYWDEEEDLLEQEEHELATAPRRVHHRGQASQALGNLYLVTGLILGAAVGLFIAWKISPVQYKDLSPAVLAAPYKDVYRQVIAEAYTADNDLGRARERIQLLGAENPVQALAAQAQRMLAENRPPQEARPLAVLAAELGREENQSVITPSITVIAGNSTSPLILDEDNTASTQTTPFSTLDIPAAVQTPTPVITFTQTATLPPQPTYTQRPSATPVIVSEAQFILTSKENICDKNKKQGLLQIEVLAADGSPLAGIPILINWQGGENSFSTGLAPEVSPGYADFLMTQGVTYRLKVGEASKAVDGVTIPSCEGGVKMTFTQGKE